MSVSTLCYIVDGQGDFKHIFAAQESSEARSVLTVKTSLKQAALEKYFIQEEDIGPIIESLQVKPTVFTFSRVFRTSNTVDLYDHLTDETSNAIRTGNNLAWLITSTTE